MHIFSKGAKVRDCFGFRNAYFWQRHKEVRDWEALTGRLASESLLKIRQITLEGGWGGGGGVYMPRKVC